MSVSRYTLIPTDRVLGGARVVVYSRYMSQGWRTRTQPPFCPKETRQGCARVRTPDMPEAVRASRSNAIRIKNQKKKEERSGLPLVHVCARGSATLTQPARDRAKECCQRTDGRGGSHMSALPSPNLLVTAPRSARTRQRTDGRGGYFRTCTTSTPASRRRADCPASVYRSPMNPAEWRLYRRCVITGYKAPLSPLIGRAVTPSHPQ